MTTSIADSARSWPSHTSKQYHYCLRYPPDWIVDEERPEKLTLRSADSEIQLSVSFWPMDCSRTQAIFRGPPRFNLYLLREFRIRLSNQDTTAFEFRDTIARAKETRALLPAPSGCYEVRWRRSESAVYPELDAAVETILSTFDLHSG
jgi:hypothetical protein